jgi:hypothetical protein
MSKPVLQSLPRELQGILPKRPGDGQRFALSKEGTLTLEKIPTGLISTVLDWIEDFLYDRTQKMQRKLVQINTQVTTYLDAEKEPAKLQAFLQKYTPALNELYREAARIGIWLKLSKKFQQLVHTPKQTAQSYAAKARLELSHSLEGAKVGFEIQHAGNRVLPEKLERREHSPGSNYAATFNHDFSDKVSIQATVTRTEKLPSFDQHLIVRVDNGGRAAFETQPLPKGEKSKMTFISEQPVTIRCLNKDENTFVTIFLERGEKTIEVEPKDYQHVETTVIKAELLHFGFKKGLYQLALDENGVFQKACSLSNR